MSAAFFNIKPPAKRLEHPYFHTTREGEPEDYSSCWDGCLLDKDSLNVYKKIALFNASKK